jgi:hypothetical protein
MRLAKVSDLHAEMIEHVNRLLVPAASERLHRSANHHKQDDDETKRRGASGGQIGQECHSCSPPGEAFSCALQTLTVSSLSSQES